jgi:4-methylaminobutanoate oxidase (formaldehyde-forming)
VQGPRSRELLQSLTTADLSNDAFPFRTAREIDIGFARCCACASPTSASSATSSTSRRAGVHVYDRIVAPAPRSVCATPG